MYIMEKGQPCPRMTPVPESNGHLIIPYVRKILIGQILSCLGGLKVLTKPFMTRAHRITDMMSGIQTDITQRISLLSVA